MQKKKDQNVLVKKTFSVFNLLLILVLDKIMSGFIFGKLFIYHYHAPVKLLTFCQIVQRKKVYNYLSINNKKIPKFQSRKEKIFTICNINYI